MGKLTGIDVTEGQHHWRCHVKDPGESRMADKWVPAHLTGTKIKDEGSKSNQHEGPIQKGQKKNTYTNIQNGQKKNHPYQCNPWSPVPITTHEVQCQCHKVNNHSLPSCIIAMTIHMDNLWDAYAAFVVELRPIHHDTCCNMYGKVGAVSKKRGEPSYEYHNLGVHNCYIFVNCFDF